MEQYARAARARRLAAAGHHHRRAGRRARPGCCASSRAFIDELPDLIRWRQGRCLPYGDGVRLLGARRDRQGAGRHPGVRRSRGGGGRSSPTRSTPSSRTRRERDWLRRRLAPLIGAGGESTDVPREELFTAWRRFVEALAVRGPTGAGLRGPALGGRPAARVHRASASSGRAASVHGGLLRPAGAVRPVSGWGGGRRNAITSVAAAADRQRDRAC